MNYIKALNVLGKLVKSGQIKSVEEAIGTLQQMGAKVDGLLRQGVENLFKTTKARNPEAFKGWTPSVIEGGKEKAAILADRKKTMEKFGLIEKEGVENLFKETKRVNIPANKLNHQKIAEQAGIDIELIKGKDWVEILEVLKGLNKADGGRIGFRNGGFDYESEAYGAPDTIASITRHGGGGGSPTPPPPPPRDDGGNRLNISPVVTYNPYHQIENVGLRANIGKLMAAGMVNLEDVIGGNIDPTIAGNVDLGNFNLGGVKAPEQSGIFGAGNVGPVNVQGSYDDFGEFGTSKNIGASGMLGNLGMGVNYDFENKPNVGLSYNDPAGGLSGSLNYNFEGKPEGRIEFKKTFKKGGRVGFQQGGTYDSRATVEDMAKAIQTSSAGTDDQKLRLLMDYSGSVDPQATLKTIMDNQGKMEKLLGLQSNPTFDYMKPSGPAMIMPPMASTGFRQDPGYFGNKGIIINGKRYMSEEEAIEDMGVETYNRFMANGGRVGYNVGGLTGQAKNIYDAWLSAGHSEADVLAYLESRGLYNPQDVGITSIVNTQKPIIPQGDGGDGDGGNTITPYDPNVNLGPNKDVIDYEADAYNIGPTFRGQFARLRNAYSKIPTPFNIAKMGWQKAKDWADDRRIEKENAAAAAEAALQAQITAQAHETASDLVSKGASRDWGKTETRDSSGWKSNPFAKGGLATMFTRRR